MQRLTTVFELSEKIALVDGARSKTSAGFVTATARVARTGIQQYRGNELGLIDVDVVNVWRPDTEVMEKSSMWSFAHKPITDNHPPELVDSTNVQKHFRGITGGEIARDGEFITVPLSLMDASLIDAVDSGKRELSAGYTCDIEFVDGVTPDGDTYNAIQRNIRVNHIAVVDRGRAGHQCRLGDASKTEKEVIDMSLQTITFDGLSVEVTNQGAQVIKALQTRLADAVALNDTAATAHAVELAARDTELGTKDAEISVLTDAAMTPAKLDALVVDRSDTITKAKTFGDVDTVGKSNADIRRSAVSMRVGDEKLAGKSDDYVAALFDAYASDADPVRSKLQTPAKLKDGKPAARAGDDVRIAAYDEYTASLNPAKEGS